MHWSFGKYWFSSAIFQMLHFIYKIVNNHIYLYTTNLSKKVFKCWYAIKLLGADSSFSKFENSDFITDNTVSWFSWSGRITFFQFQENVSQILKESAYLYCVLPSKDVAPPNKSLLQFETHLHTGFSGDKHSTSAGRSTLQVLNLNMSL